MAKRAYNGKIDFIREYSEIVDAIEEAADHFGVDKAEYCRAAIRDRLKKDGFLPAEFNGRARAILESK